MYVLILVLFPLLYLFNPRLALAALIVGIVGMYFQRTRTSKPPNPRRPAESRVSYSPSRRTSRCLAASTSARYITVAGSRNAK